MYKEKKFKVKIKRNRANNLLVCNKLKCHAFLYFVCKKNPTTNRKTFIKKRNILINLEKMKINKNQIRIMFVLKKTINIRNRKFKI